MLEEIVVDKQKHAKSIPASSREELEEDTARSDKCVYDRESSLGPRPLVYFGVGVGE